MDGSALVGVVMGSDSDWPVMQAAAAVLDEFGVRYEADVVSAHRMPHDMIGYGQAAAGRGLKVIIAGAGGAAHLPGMLAAVTPLPVIGVPVPLTHLDGLDSLLTADAAGVPVATVSIGGRETPARGAHPRGLRPGAAAAMTAFQADLGDKARSKGAALAGTGPAWAWLASDGPTSCRPVAEKPRSAPARSGR
jgi:5-(carboxyamino)imidazole ribonucleotide mutase